ncbi:hypothetical protein O6H91_15G060300 [Diphasiastrum complanatum]|uniref:Uncharacterized protein n=1 Tax=Diphasiastrum complanatum TaxID=34168 RepID=A0ACC2BIP7_DIPCM|nr:hypothetical protein O6H91_15G060300 [Diphasiastrum complanatum]
MGSKKGSGADQEDSGGLSWADQWGNHDDADNAAFKGQEGAAANSGNKKFSVYEKKMKAAASTGLEKAKSAASVGAQKMKAGTTTGIRWIKDQYQKRSSK